MALVRAEEAAPVALVTDVLDEGKDWKSVSHLPSIEDESVLVFSFGDAPLHILQTYVCF